MKIVIAAATEFELEQVRQIQTNKHEVTFVVHGIGIMAACYHIQKVADTKPDLILQCGLAGSYDANIHIGDTVLVHSEMTDIGAEDDNALLDPFDLNLLNSNEFPYKNGLLPCPFLSKKKFGLPSVAALTVNCSSGSELTINKRIIKFHPSIETMEGAALHYVGLMSHTHFLQIKTISNNVEKRNKENWNIQLALKNNAIELSKIVAQL